MKRKTIGEQIMFYRKKRGLTQDQLAQKVGLSRRSIISGMETGLTTPSHKTLERIADALDCMVEIKLKPKE